MYSTLSLRKVILTQLLFAVCILNACAQTTTISQYLTTANKSSLLQAVPDAISWTDGPASGTVIKVDAGKIYQEIDGFGYTLTGGSASLINQLPDDKKNALLRDLFSGDGIGVSYLRISIGASDLSASLFTYNELPTGETDAAQKKFSLKQEQSDLIPVLKKIVAINPKIKILGSPWTAPTWMKDNKNFKGGSLLKQYFPAYARYFVRYVQAMQKEGITIDAITPQNEPLHPGNNPSMFMSATDQAAFIRLLGPALKKAGIKTKIIAYDHNADRPDYPLTVLRDPEANKWTDGSAFHLYAGKLSALSEVHDAFPNKNIYFTEQWVGGPGNFAEDLKWHVGTLLVGATRNWSRTVLEWNVAADANYGPHTDKGGCTSCLGAITINGEEVTRNVAWYVIGHASKFVQPGSKRIESDLATGLPNVAFKTPGGNTVLIVMNTTASDQKFSVQDRSRHFSTSVPAGAAATLTW
ncbi:glycoside hydrolase family 30 beta sandwich domain-containing protein [Pedobacter sp. SYP-B3415]|uniref:glycoside hydrolase family 30 protein n=1 Tax=Pedobacter sp. SYP-B3415 TaxID=2496641 RepID=UPI00101D8565|nr:glycoside hydrolase family 30 beta sandwich domain-containing protein [Pedobacter sp. SYP-B3415]